ncbi:MAG: type II secretion system protein GspE, partial [Ghiorsea sp.]|nr:type II secretion system protein GspE [Ghiorsea sp.]
MLRLNRVNNEQVDEGRLMCFSLPVLRSAALLPLKPTEDMLNPVAVAEESVNTATWPWELLDDCRREFGAEVEPILVPKDAILMAL